MTEQQLPCDGQCRCRNVPEDRPTSELIVLSVTHELRQPLSVIAGYAELLAQRAHSEHDEALLREIRRAAERLAAALCRLERADRFQLVPLCGGARRVLDLRPEPAWSPSEVSEPA